MKATIIGLFLIALVSISIPSVFSKSEDVMNMEDMVMFVEAGVSNEEGKLLVPTTAILKGNDTKYLTHKYYVEVSKGLDFTVSVDDIFINDSREYSDEMQELFMFEIEYREVDEDTTNLFEFNDETITYEVFVIITMNEPESREQYELVTLNRISVDYAFMAV